jgi:zinc protease
MKPHRSLVSVLLAGIFSLSASSATLAQGVGVPPRSANATPVAQDASSAQTFTLSNGMTLIVLPDHRAATVVHMVWVRVGSMDEVSGTSGVAHVLEHMMFKGTPTVPEGEFSRRVAALGGRDNAFTHYDVTAFHQQVPASRLEDVMALEADRFAHMQWTDDAFRREMGVIQEERRQRTEESPQALMFEAFNATAFLAHPYRRPIIGWMSDLQAMTPADARAFHQRWYTPANAAVVVVGDVDAEQVRALAEKHYGSIAARAVPPRKPQVEPVQSGERRVVYRGRTQQPMLLLGYKVPQLTDPAATDEASQDALALLMLAGVLDGTSASRLERRLVQGQGGRRLADSVSASYGLMGRGPQLFMLSGAPTAGTMPEALESALKAEIERIARDGVTEAELQRVRNQWMAGEVFKLDSMFAQARELGSQWSLGWPVDAEKTLMQRLTQVTPAQVQGVARRYFGDRQLTVGLLLPEDAQ